MAALKKTVNWFADEHYKLKKKRDALKDKAKLVQKDIDKLEGEALEKFGKEGIEGARGRNATAFIQELDHYNITDRSKLDKYVKRTGNFEIFQNRVSGAAIEEISANNSRFKLESAGLGLYTSVHFRTRKR